MEDKETIVITAFYHFFNFPNFECMKEPLLAFCKKQGLKGTILLAKEGINSTISGSRQGIDALYKYLKEEFKISNLSYKESFNEEFPFEKMKVRLKKEIVALGVENLDIDNLKGEYIKPQEWDEFISKEDVLVVDTRNKYETLLGSFDRAIDPKTDTFREFPKWVEENLGDVDKDKKIAMFCTGGIRCEKSTAYMRSQGFKNVYHLEGGILQYFEDTKAESWRGSCFVFDERVSLNRKLDAAHLHCIKCDKDMDTDDIRRSALADEMTCIKCVEHHGE